MNNKKIMVLLVLLVAVVGFTLASVSAASTQSKTFTVKDNSIVTKSLGKGDKVSVYYTSNFSPQYNMKRFLAVTCYGFDIDPNYHKISKVKVYLKNKNKQTVVRTYDTAAGGKIIKVSSKETPYKVVVYYKTYKNKIVY